MLCILIEINTPVRKGQAHFCAFGNREHKITQLDSTTPIIQNVCSFLPDLQKNLYQQKARYSWFHVFIPTKHYKEHYFLQPACKWLMTVFSDILMPADPVNRFSSFQLCSYVNYKTTVFLYESVIFIISLLDVWEHAVNTCWDSMCHRKN